MAFTMAQEQAINARGNNLLLAAAAGSGKTTVLVERVLRLIREGADVGRMLIVTFTRASAADMRLALMRKLEDAAAAAPEDVRLREQAEAASSAGISTIHSFCGELLREHFQAAGVDPAFRVLDTAEADALREKALDEAMNSCYADMDADMLALTENRPDRDVRDLTLRLYTAAFNRPDPFGWLDESVSRLERSEDAYSPILLEEARAHLLMARAKAVEVLAMSAETPAPEKYADCAQSDLDLVDGMLDLGYDALRAAAAKPGYKSKPRSPKGDNSDENWVKLRKDFKKYIEKIRDVLPFSLADGLDDLPALAAELRALVRLVRALDEAFARLKEQRLGLTYDDLEHRALKALREEGVREALRERYTHILVDEYQDISDVQETILTSLSRGDNMFFVGDVKQSIYRFRNAEPSLFQGKYDRFAEGDGGQLVYLNTNFRSRKTILDFTNAVFSRVMRGGASEIDYDERAALNYGGGYEGEDPPVELALISGALSPDVDREELDEGTLDILDMEDVQAEAAYAARRIRALVGTPTYDVKKGVTRPLQYRDIAILTRQGKNVIPLIQDILAREGIPTFADLSGAYIDVAEVRMALAILGLCDNMRRDYAWIGALRSPVVGLDSPQLAQIRLCLPEGSFYDAVMACAKQDQGPLGETLRLFIDKIRNWRALRRHMPLSRFIFRVLSGSGLYAFVGAMKGGEQRQVNLDMLCDRAAAFEARSNEDLAGFLRSLEKSAAGGDNTSAHVLDENEDVVRLMTVHKSKGLEFQVVIGMRLGQNLSSKGRHGELETHARLGVGMKHVDNVLKTRRDTLPQLAIKLQRAHEELAEEMRILYVLMTRARDRLILTAGVKDTDSLSQYAAASDLMPSSFLQMVLPAALTLPGSEDARALAYPASGGFEIEAEGPRVDIRVMTRLELGLQKREEMMDTLEIIARARRAGADQGFLRDYEWRYPHEGDVYMPLKLTASGLTHELTGPAQPPALVPRPAFLKETGAALTGAERGTAVHDALMHIDLQTLRDAPGEARVPAIIAQLDDMRHKGLLTAAQREVVSPSMIARFFAHGAGERLLKADTVRREWMFTLAMTAREALDLDTDEMVMVQGSIDCCFIEDGRWILIDYKTDRDEGDDALRARYAPQLRLYRIALERITGVPVQEAMLCLVRAGRDIPLI